MRQTLSNPCKYWAEACPTFFSKMRQNLFYFVDFMISVSFLSHLFLRNVVSMRSVSNILTGYQKGTFGGLIFPWHKMTVIFYNRKKLFQNHVIFRVI